MTHVEEKSERQIRREQGRNIIFGVFDEMLAIASEDPELRESLIKIVALESGIILGWLEKRLGFTPDEAIATTRYWYSETPDIHTMPYADYLQTEHWQAKRKEALERALYHCQVCYSSTALNVHHRTYKRRGNELPEDLIVLCKSCHQLLHDNGKLEVEE